VDEAWSVEGVSAQPLTGAQSSCQAERDPERASSYANRLEELMPGLGGRIETLTKAKISHLLDRAEDPAETLDYAYEQQIEDLQKVKQGIADVVTSKKRLQLQEEQLKQQADKLDGQAREAMSAGREDLARAAVERKQLIVQETSSLDQQVADLESQQQKLTDAERNLQTKVEQFRTKKEVIKAQYSASEAQVQISEAATGIGDHMADLGEAMQRAIDKTDQMQARASAVEELQAAGTFEDLTSLGPPQDDIDRQLDQLGAKSAVDDELAQLKAEVGPGTKPEAPQIGAGEGSS
jgi:phage shock protein A